MADERDLNISSCSMNEVLQRLSDRMELISASDEELQGICDEFVRSQQNSDSVEEPPTIDILKDAARLPMLLVGKPGIGKTLGILGMVGDWNKEHPSSKHFGFKKIVLSMTEVGSMQGIPMVVDGKAVRIPVSDFPDENRDGKYGILFLDEITTADTQQVQPILPICDGSRSIGEYTLPEHWLVVAAGNRPDDANFVEMKDMVISRFEAFNVETEYHRDWRPWARANGVLPIIIAFLNFKPDSFVKVVTDIDAEPEVGKQFATGRTWEALSKNLKARKVMGREVSQTEMYSFASRFIGAETAREFAAFCSFRDQVAANPKAIIQGKEKPALEILTGKDGTLKIEAEKWHILMQGIFSGLKVLVESTYDRSTGCFPDETIKAVANAIDWILPVQEYQLELVVNAIVEMRNEIDLISTILGDTDFDTVWCPAYGMFIMNHAAMLADVSLSL